MDVLSEWKAIPQLVQAVVTSPSELDDRVGPARFALTRRQLVHHIAEANVVAASILVAALGSPGCTFDWSWMLPFGPWVERLDYAHKPVEPSLHLLEALNAYVVAQVEPLEGALSRAVFLRDSPDAALRETTVAAILAQEVDHVREHLASE